MAKTTEVTPRNFHYYDIIVAAFAAVLLISNLAAVKLIAFGPIIADGGAVLFPLAYIFGDILTEVYGYKFERRAIWTGFFIMLLAVFAFTVVRYLPAAPGWNVQKSYVDILGFFPRIVGASLIAYLVGEFMNSFVLAKLKIRMNGKKMWVRFIGSTIVGEFFDTIIFCLIAFGGLISGHDMLSYILVGWLFKTGVEVVMLPVTYRVVAFLKKKEGVDHYDRQTNFTPFSLSVEETTNN